MLSGILFENSVMSVDAIHCGDNLSDHEPIVIKLCLDIKLVSLLEKYIVIKLHGIKRRIVI